MLNKLNYILDHFKKVYRLAEIPVSFSYGVKGQAKIRIKPGVTSSLEKKEQYIPEDNQIVWKPWKGTMIPFFFSNDTGDLIIRTGDDFIISQDIIASAFFLLSGWHEYYAVERDKYGRFPFEKSLQKRLKIIGKPIVNYYFDILKTIIEKVWGKPISNFSWGGKPFALCLTHDIDTCESGWLQGGLHALKKGQIFNLLTLLLKKISGKDAWFNFEDILQLEQTYIAHSTFFFLTSHVRRNGIKNADYDMRDPRFKTVHKFILIAGSEVGVHGSIGSADDPCRLETELNYFQVPILGNRFHFLLYDPGRSGRVIDENGLVYDSSLGFAEQPGFRNSFCFPYHPWDFENDRPFSHFEIPLNLMDGTLQKYMNLRPEEALPHVEVLFEEVIKFGGCVTVLWHNTHFSEYKYAGWRKVYTNLLDLALKDNAGFLSCQNVLEQYSSQDTE